MALEGLLMVSAIVLLFLIEPRITLVLAGTLGRNRYGLFYLVCPRTSLSALG